MKKGDIEEVLLFQIDKTSKISKLYSQREFDQLGWGITVEQWIVLKIVHENEGISQKDLATRSFRDPASITRTLDLLGKKGLVERQPTPDNRRQYRLALTKAGQVFVDQYMPLVREHRQRSLRGFSAEEMATLRDLLLRVQENMKR